MQTKEYRTICVRCLVMLCCSYLARYGTAMPKLELHKWLDKTLKPVIAVAKKGGLTVQEQHEVVEPIMVRACATHACTCNCAGRACVVCRMVAWGLHAAASGRCGLSHGARLSILGS